MSRIGRQPIPIPKGVEVKLSKTAVSIKGPKGSLTVETLGRVEVTQEDGALHVARFDDSRQQKAFHGLYQRLIANSVKGVTEGFKKELEIQGVGYRAQMQGKNLVLSLGYSHPINFAPPAGIKVDYDAKANTIAIEGIDKQSVGQVAAKIRGFRPPEPYLGKGVRYKGEQIKLKEGKSSK